MTYNLSVVDQAWMNVTLTRVVNGSTIEITATAFEINSHLPDGLFYVVAIVPPSIPGSTTPTGFFSLPFSGNHIVTTYPVANEPQSATWHFYLQYSFTGSSPWFHSNSSSTTPTNHHVDISGQEYSMSYSADPSLNTYSARRKNVGDPATLTIGTFNYTTTVDAGITSDYDLKVPNVQGLTEPGLSNPLFTTDVVTMNFTRYIDTVTDLHMSGPHKIFRGTSINFSTSEPCTTAKIYSYKKNGEPTDTIVDNTSFVSDDITYTAVVDGGNAFVKITSPMSVPISQVEFVSFVLALT